MKVSQDNQRLQKTKYLGSIAKDREEFQDRQRVHRRFSATSKGETNEFEYGSLERILSRSKPITLEQRIIKLNKINIDWINYYGIAKRKGTLEQLDKTKIKNVYMETVEKG